MQTALTTGRIFTIYMRQAFYHRAAALSTIFVWIVRSGVTCMVYTSIYALLNHNTIRNVSYDTAISSLLLAVVYAGFGTREIGKQINVEYKAGLISVWANKPLPYMFLKMAEVVGRNIPSMLGLLLFLVGFWVIGDHFPQTDHITLRIGAGLIVLLLGLILSVCIYTMIGLSAFFLGDSQSVYMVIDKLMMLFGGVYIPIAFYPGWLRLIGESTPFGATTYVTQIFMVDFLDRLPRFLITQSIWLVVMVVALIALNRAANRQITVNGG